MQDDAHRLRNHFDQLFDTPITILQLAVQGQLVPQDPNDAPPALLHSDHTPVSIDSVPFTAPTLWRWFQVSEFFDVSCGITPKPKRTPVKNHFPYLRVANMKRGRLKLDEIERFELANGEFEHWRLEPRAILVVEGNASGGEIGRCALWNGEIADCVHQNHIIRCRPLIKDIQDSVHLC